MASYRLIITVANTPPTIPAQSVLPTAADALRTHANVEAYDIRISRGRPQLVLRYTADNPTHALTAAQGALTTIRTFIQIDRYEILNRVRTRWDIITTGQ